MDKLIHSRKFTILVLLLLVAGFLIGGYILEKPINDRRIIILSLGALIMITTFLASLRKGKFRLFLCFALTGFIFAIELYSKYSINYFYHSIYFIAVFISVMYLERKQSIMMLPIIVIGSFVKFIQLLIIEMTVLNISNFVFLGLVQILMIAIVFIARAYYVESSKTNDLYIQLLEAYNTLDDYSRELKILSAKEERTSIARDLHDTLGHELTGLIMQLELSKYSLETGENITGVEHLDGAINTARGSLTKVRGIVNTLKNQEKLIFTNQSIQELVDEFAIRTGIQVTLKQDEQVVLNPNRLLVLLRVIQEALTNTAKHSHSDHILIQIQHSHETLYFEVYDYQGTQTDPRKAPGLGIVKGNGLKGMEERLASIGGHITFKKLKAKGKGFYVEGQFPIDQLEGAAE